MLPQLMKMGLKDQECYLSSLVLYTKKHIFYSFKHDKCHLLYIFGKLIKMQLDGGTFRHQNNGKGDHDPQEGTKSGYLEGDI